MDEIDKLSIRLQGYKQKDVAARAGVGANTLSQILNRKIDPRYDTIKRIHAALDFLGARTV